MLTFAAPTLAGSFILKFAFVAVCVICAYTIGTFDAGF